MVSGMFTGVSNLVSFDLSLICQGRHEQVIYLLSVSSVVMSGHVLARTSARVSFFTLLTSGFEIKRRALMSYVSYFRTEQDSGFSFTWEKRFCPAVNKVQFSFGYIRIPGRR